jgi:hypothetical protein
VELDQLPALSHAEIVFFFHLLSFVLAAFTLRRLPRCDDVNSVPAPGVNHHQHPTEGIHSDRNLTIFSRMIILDGECGIVLKNSDRIGKMNGVS